MRSVSLLAIGLSGVVGGCGTAQPRPVAGVEAQVEKSVAEETKLSLRPASLVVGRTPGVPPIRVVRDGYVEQDW